MREKWFEHSPSTNLITHGTEGKDSGFVILRHQTLLLPGLNVDFSSERIKGPGSFPVGLATWHMIHMHDHMPLKDSVWSSVFSRPLIQVSAFILTIVTKNKAFVMEMNALTRTVSLLNSIWNLGSHWCQNLAAPTCEIQQETHGPSWNIFVHLQDECI